MHPIGGASQATCQLPTMQTEMGVSKITPLLLTLLAHGIADFILQTDKMTVNKNEGRWFGYFTHALTVLITLFLLLIRYPWGISLGYALLISFTHVLIDLFKPFLTYKKEMELPGFLLDQCLHIIAIGMIWQAFQSKLVPVQAVTAFLNTFIMPETVSVFTGTFPRIEYNGIRLLISVIMYVYVCWGGGFLVQKFLLLLHPSNDGQHVAGNGKTGHIGFWIGVLERLIILTLVINDVLGAVAFIFTAKSIARFNELNDKTFAEYYLTGTLLSTALAVFGGFLLNGLTRGIL